MSVLICAMKTKQMLKSLAWMSSASCSCLLSLSMKMRLWKKNPDFSFFFSTIWISGRKCSKIYGAAEFFQLCDWCSGVKVQLHSPFFQVEAEIGNRWLQLFWKILWKGHNQQSIRRFRATFWLLTLSLTLSSKHIGSYKRHE